MFGNRGKFYVVMDEAGELTGGSGGTADLGTAGDMGGFDLAAAGDTISTDLFGASPAEAGEGNTGVTTAAEPTTPATTTAPAAPATEALQAPKTWRPEAAAKFATLPAEVQQEVLKREEDIFKGLESYKADAGLGKSLKAVLQPYEQTFRAQGIDPMQQVSGLLHAHVTLATASPEQKIQYFQKIAQSYGVDVGTLAGGEAPFVDPQVAGLQKELSDIKSRLNGREQQEVAQARTKLQSEIDTFASDPAHQYFDEVANDIAGLLRSGAAQDLKDAYDKAIWANPITRAKEQARLAAEAETKAKADATERAKQARKATGANVKSSAKAASGTAPLESIDDTLEATLANIKSRA